MADEGEVVATGRFVVDRQVRGCTPSPGAWTTHGDERLKLGPVVVDADHPALGPGEVAVGKNAVHVGTASHAVRLGAVLALSDGDEMRDATVIQFAGGRAVRVPAPLEEVVRWFG